MQKSIPGALIVKATIQDPPFNIPGGSGKAYRGIFPGRPLWDTITNSWLFPQEGAGLMRISEDLQRIKTRMPVGDNAGGDYTYNIIGAVQNGKCFVTENARVGTEYQNRLWKYDIASMVLEQQFKTSHPSQRIYEVTPLRNGNLAILANGFAAYTYEVVLLTPNLQVLNSVRIDAYPTAPANTAQRVRGLSELIELQSGNLLLTGYMYDPDYYANTSPVTIEMTPDLVITKTITYGMTYPGGFDEAVEVDGTVYTVGSVSISNTRAAFTVAALKGDASFIRVFTFAGTIAGGGSSRERASVFYWRGRLYVYTNRNTSDTNPGNASGSGVLMRLNPTDLSLEIARENFITSTITNSRWTTIEGICVGDRYIVAAQQVSLLCADADLTNCGTSPNVAVSAVTPLDSMPVRLQALNSTFTLDQMTVSTSLSIDTDGMIPAN